MARYSIFKRIGRPFLIIAAFVALLLPSYFRWFDAYEFELLDARFLVRGQQPTTNEIVLIEIGDDTLQKLGEWPIDRDYYALLVKALTDAGAKQIIFDIFFSERSARDAKLAEEIRASGLVYLPMVLEVSTEASMGSRVPRADRVAGDILKEFASSAKAVGHINIIPDMDGKYRRVPLYIEYKGELYPYLSFLAAADYLGISEAKIRFDPGKEVRLGDKIRIPLDDRSRVIINYSGRWASSFKHYSFVDILQSSLAFSTGQVPILDLGVLKDKVCVIGLTATGTTDLHPMPWEPLYPAMGIHAEIFSSILNNRFVSRVSREVNLAILLVMGVVVLTTLLRARPLIGLLVLAAAVIVLGTSAIALFFFGGIWIDLFYPVSAVAVSYLALTFYKYIVEHEKRQIFEREMSIAQTIQESFLPKTVPTKEMIEIAVKMFPARQVGGDLYDFFDLGPELLGVMIGDVSGKGMPASLFMAKVMSDAKYYVNAAASPSKVLSELNKKLVSEPSGNLFVTAMYLIFDTAKRSFLFASGGHLPVILIRKGEEKARFLDTKEGTPLGLIEGSYSEDSVELVSGDTLVLYTDGVTEAMDREHEMYGGERLARLVRQNSERSPEEIVTIVRRDVQKFEGKANQHDDITILVMRIR